MEGRYTDAALTRKQRVFACVESAPGRLTFPQPTDAIRPAGDATMNQAPSYTDSSEKFDTLDLLDQFPNAMPPGEWQVPQYVRMAGFGLAPQGLALFESAFGRKGEDVYAELDDDITDTDTSIVLSDVAGDVPPVGAIKIDDEIIRYGKYDKVSHTLSECVRGYDHTTAAAHLEDTPIEMLSVLYVLDTCYPTLTIWVETDHLIQYMTGCVVEELTVPVQNTDGLKLTFKGRGMAMGWAGKSPVKTAASAGDSVVVVTDPKRYCEGARIYNRDKNDFGTEGYAVKAVNEVSGELTLESAILQDWDVDDEVSGYLPPADIGGDVILSRDTTIMLDGVPGKVTQTNLTIGTPVEFLEEVGTKFPEEYVGIVRKVSMNVDTILRRASVDKFKEGYLGKESEVVLTMGADPGQKVSFYMPRLKTSVPTVQFSGPAATLQISGTALGMVDGQQVGENSVCAVFE